jgi:mRNA interferase MazF
MKYKQRDIVLLPIPYTNRQMKEVRPAIIVSNEIVNATQDCMVIPLSSVLRGDEMSLLITNELLISPLKASSEARLHKIYTTEQKEIVRKIGEMTPKGFEVLLAKLMVLLAQIA